jgi:hypothetical protein
MKPPHTSQTPHFGVRQQSCRFSDVQLASLRAPLKQLNSISLLSVPSVNSVSSVLILILLKSNCDHR